MQFPQTFCHVIALGSNILLSTLFSNILSLCSYLNVRDQVSHQIRKQRKNYNFAYSDFYIFSQQTRRQKFWTEWQQALPEFSLLLISSWIKFWFVTVVPKYLNCATFSKDLLSIVTSWFCPAFWWRDSNVHFASSSFTYRPSSLLTAIKVYVFFFMLSPSRLTPSA
jgi:hypothetical protein